MKRFLLFFIALIAINPIQSQEIKNINWEKDIKVLQKKLPEKHKYLFYVRTRAQFNKDIESLLTNYKNLSDLGVAIKMQQLVARLGDAHTNIDWQNFIDDKKQLPLKLYWFKEGIFVLQTVEANKDLLGKRITKINQTPINTIIDSLSTLIVNDNISLEKGRVPKLIPNLQLLEYFNFTKGDIAVIETEDLQGKLESFEVRPAILNKGNRITCNMDSISFPVKNEKEFFVDKYFEKDGIYYIQYNICYSKEVPPYNFKGDKNTLPSFIEFGNKVIETINEKPIKKVIVDLRYNGGGSSPQGTEFVKKLSGVTKINQKGIMYVVISRHTFSSAIINTLDFKKFTKATLIGEETGGKPNHFGEVKKFNLPSSKINVFYSSKFFRMVDKDVNTINPDIKIEESFKDFQAGIDPIYEWIKNN